MTGALLVAAGGALGSVARHFVSVAAGDKFGPQFGYRSFFVNATGCFLMGLFAAKLSAGRETEKLFLLTGFCGGYTTFSAFALELSVMARAGEAGKALFYAAASTAAGLALLTAGYVVGEKLR